MPGSVSKAIEDGRDGPVVTDSGQLTNELDGILARRAPVLAGAIPGERQLGMNAPAPMQPEQVPRGIVGDVENDLVQHRPENALLHARRLRGVRPTLFEARCAFD